MNTFSICSERLLLTDLGLHDVLLGRGTGPNGNPGNVRLRHMLRRAILDADSLPMSAQAKAQLSVQIFQQTSAAGGRFVRKLSKEEAKLILSGKEHTAKRSPIFQVVSASVAIKKIKLSFRHQLQHVPVSSKSLFKMKSSESKTLPTVGKKILQKEVLARLLSRDIENAFPRTTPGIVLQSRSQIRINDLLRSHWRLTAAKRLLLETLLLEKWLLDSVTTTNSSVVPRTPF